MTSKTKTNAKHESSKSKKRDRVKMRPRRGLANIYGYSPGIEESDSEKELTEEEELYSAEEQEDESKELIGKLIEDKEQGSNGIMKERRGVKARSRTLQDIDRMQNLYRESGDEPNVYLYYQKACTQYTFRYVHDPAMGEPLSFDNGRYWEPLTEDRIHVMIYGMLEEDDKKKIYNCKLFCASVTIYIKLQCAKEYYDGNRFTEKQFMKIQNHAVFKNGVYDAHKGRLREFNTKLPYTFGLDADYIGEDVETTAWDKLRMDASGDKESMAMLEYWIGYLAIPNLSAKAMAVMASAKDSGKSICGQFCAEMYEGTRTEAMDPDKLSGRFAYAKAATTLLLYCFDLNTEQLKAADVAELKKITGEKTIRSEAKYQMAVTMPIRFKVMLATNTGLYLGKGAQQDDAFYRRVIVLPFVRSRESDEMMNDMLDRLRAERSAILSKCVRKVGEIIGPDGGITFPESDLSRSIKESWSKRIDMVKMFVESMLDITGNMNDAIIKDKIYSEYVSFVLKKTYEMDLKGYPTLLRTACMTRIIDLAGGKVAQSKIRIDSEQTNPRYKCYPGEQKPCLRGLKWKASNSSVPM